MLAILIPDCCCQPRSCCFGRVNLVHGAALLALADVLLHILLLAFLLTVRPFLQDPPSTLKSILWIVLLILVDLLLLHGLRFNKTVSLLIWQTVFLVHTVLLVFGILFFCIFGFPNLDHLVSQLARKEARRDLVTAAIIVIFVWAIIFVPFHLYSFRVVNGAKAECERVSIEEQATLASQRIIVRRASDDPELELQQANEKKLWQELSDRQWVHQDVIAPVYFGKEGETTSAYSPPTQPIYQVQTQDPMQPFMPLYEPQERLGSGSGGGFGGRSRAGSVAGGVGVFGGRSRANSEAASISVGVFGSRASRSNSVVPVMTPVMHLRAMPTVDGCERRGSADSTM